MAATDRDRTKEVHVMLDKNTDKNFSEGGMRVSFRGSGASCYRQTSETRLIRECFDLHRRCISPLWRSSLSGQKGAGCLGNLTKGVVPPGSVFTFGGKSRIEECSKRKVQARH